MSAPAALFADDILFVYYIVGWWVLMAVLGLVFAVRRSRQQRERAKERDERRRARLLKGSSPSRGVVPKRTPYAERPPHVWDDGPYF